MSQDVEKERNPVALFRKHRHDILNQLQLIRAYVQVGREPDAIRIVDETARWLQSLTTWQTHCGAFAERLVFAASNCPHLVLAGADEIENWDNLLVDEIEQILFALEEQASENGWSHVPLYLRSPRNRKDPVQLVVELSNKMQSRKVEWAPACDEGMHRVALSIHCSDT